MRKIFNNTSLIFICFLMIVPLIFVIMGSTHDSGWMFSIPLDYSLGNYFFINLNKLILEQSFYASLFNSMIVSTITALLSVAIIGLASYGFSMFNFYGKKILLTLCIILISLPNHSSLIGQLLIINELGMYSTLFGLIIPFVINIRVFIILNGLLSNIEKNTLDSARVDGANEFQVMNRIVFPQVKDKLLLAFFLIFIASWNNFLIPMLISFDSSTFTLPVLISSLADPLRYDTGKVFIGLLIQVAPVVLLFGLINKKIFAID